MSAVVNGNGGGNGNGAGAFRRVVLPMVQTILGALTIAGVLWLFNLQTRITIMESVGNLVEFKTSFQRRIDAHDGRLKAIEDWRSEGRRFTAQDGEKLKAELMREIDRPQREIDASGRRGTAARHPFEQSSDRGAGR